MQDLQSSPDRSLNQGPSLTTPAIEFPLRLSQGQLNLLTACPRKFQHTYLEQLAAPVDFEQQERLSQGSRFHLLMQQWQLGLPVESLLQEDIQLQRWFIAFANAAPDILTLDPPGCEPLRQSEHARTLEFQGYLLTVVYDLLISDDRQAKILDWKTYPRPKKHLNELLQNWQTRLYPFVLAETSAYAPEHLSMTYWFFQSQGDAGTTPQNLTIAYDQVKHEQTRRDLSGLLLQLTQWLENYQRGIAFPQLPQTAKTCGNCSFTVQCGIDDRAHPQPGPQATLHSFPLPSLSEIQEVPLLGEPRTGDLD